MVLIANNSPELPIRCHLYICPTTENGTETGCHEDGRQIFMVNPIKGFRQIQIDQHHASFIPHPVYDALHEVETGVGGSVLDGACLRTTNQFFYDKYQPLPLASWLNI